MSRRLSRTKRAALVLVPAALVFGASAASASNVGVDVNLHFGNQPQIIVPAPAPPPPPQIIMPAPPPQVIVREPAPPAVVTIDNDVDFVYPSRLGFYVAVGVPYDLFYVRGNYYLFRDGLWFCAADSRGPWVAARYRELPPGLRRNTIERIRSYRTAEYDVYRRDRDHYRGRHFITPRESWKEERRAEKERWKEARREEKEYQKEMRRAEKEERKAEKEEWKRHRGWGD
ncbi:MAG TPA: hypothetical protein VI389_11740 [Geobacteraceae bacterium]